MARLVQKFGGTSVRDVNHIKHVAQIIAHAASQGNQVVTVVSAMGHTTDNLIALADAVTADASPREMDMLLATGEQVSIALTTMALNELGIAARSFTGAQAGILAEPRHQSARILEVRTSAIEAALAAGQVAIVAGFQGTTAEGEICTLGRGGSDTTAVALAAALGCDACDIYTDVDGVYTADPRSFVQARKLEAVSFEEMLEMAAAGAQVLNARSVEMAMYYQMPVRLRSTFKPDDPGTLITHRTLAPQHVVCGIACDTNRIACHLKLYRRARVRHQKMPSQLRRISLLLRHLNQAGVDTDEVTLLGREDGSSVELIFIVDKRAARKVELVLAELGPRLGEFSFSSDSDIARISVIGNGLSCRRGVVAAIFDTLCSASIPVQMLTTGDIRVTALVPIGYKDEAVQRIHQRFCAYPPVDSRAIPESRVA